MLAVYAQVGAVRDRPTLMPQTTVPDQVMAVDQGTIADTPKIRPL